MNMWSGGIMTNRSTPVPAFGSVAVMAQEIDSPVKNSVKKPVFKDEPVSPPAMTQIYTSINMSRKNLYNLNLFTQPKYSTIFDCVLSIYSL